MDSIVHFEIPVDDTGRAKKFYATAFGWQTRDDKMPGGQTYTSAITTPMDEKTLTPKKPGAINGAIIERDANLKAPVITVNVESVEDTFKKVEAAGGKIVLPKDEVPGMGEFAYVADPAGNVIGLWRDLPKQ
jgi:hypothetical protein